MDTKKRLIILSVLSIAIVIAIAITSTFAFMSSQVQSTSVTEVNINSCAKISLRGEGSINLAGSYAMSRNSALKTTPYKLTVNSTCTGSQSYGIYLATLNSNTLPDSAIHYILKNSSDTIVAEGLLNEATVATSSFSAEEIRQYNSGVNGTVTNIYSLYTSSITANDSTQYSLYLYIDESATIPNTSKTFTSGVAVRVL